ncbi:killer cell lectin-like receptor subfamily B member 1B allele C [Eublepharis macularius]|uniref:Killer cell lectin-like receptor subfamily B member 1B allele C n=1 Tax=Eublepharis macularius TaxID=481883 RepID=A0AA97KW96_EUBMA|nr:killer cell lectin-like receptor subfamily B member 1B allele C [Eublepharis macularius]
MVEDEEGYMVLNFKQKKECGKRNLPSQMQDTPQCAQRHRVALGVASALILLVSGVLIALASRVLQTKAALNGTNKCPPDSAFRRQLKHFACNSLGNSTEDDAKDCKICPKAWNLHRDKCYWISEQQKTWNESREDCKAKNSTLLVIQNMKEMAFMKNIENITGKTANAFWLGLTVNKSGTWHWQWVDGSLLKEDLFSVSRPAEKNSCGVRIENGEWRMENVVTSEDCGSLYPWICEKIAFQI